MSNNNGKITAPISQSDIKAVLGISTNSLAAACQSTNINEKAAHKPTNKQSYEPLTVEQRKQTNYSTYVNQYNNPVLLIRAVMQGLAWGYSKPQPPFFRKLDFNGYNHFAKDWLNVEPQQEVISSDRSLALDIYGNGDALSNDLSALNDLLELGYLAQYSLTEINFGFLVRASQFTESVTNCYYIPLTGMQTIRDIVDNGKISIPANVFDSIGTWYIMPILTTANFAQGERKYMSITDTIDGTWYPIPYSNIINIAVVANVQDYPVDKYIDIVLYSAEASVTNRGEAMVKNIIVTVSNTSTIDAYRVVVSSATISGGVINGPVQLHAGSVNVDSNSSANLTIQGSQVDFEVADGSIERLAIDIEYYIDNNSSQRRTKYLYIDLV